MMKKVILGALAALAMTAPAAAQQRVAPAPAAAQADLALWRLDCGQFVIKQYGAFFSDTFQYPTGRRTLSAAAT
jgi:hypothetical protein